MSGEEFDKVVDNRIKKTLDVLVNKAKEYASDEDRLHNFNKDAAMSNQSREISLLNMLLKHQVSFNDIVEKLDKRILSSKFILNEKIGDIINYYILAEACIIERIRKSEVDKDGES